MQWMMLQQRKPEDYVIATGVQHSVRDFVDAAAAELGLQLAWSGKGAKETGSVARASKRWRALKRGQTIVRVDPRCHRPAEVETLLGDASKARKKLGWTPKIAFKQLVAEMMREDVEIARRDDLARRHGHKVFDQNE